MCGDLKRSRACVGTSTSSPPQITSVNDDDSVAVKPTSRGKDIIDGEVIDCTENVLVEDTVLTGFGATIGSVGPSDTRPCVNNAVFRNISMVCGCAC